MSELGATYSAKAIADARRDSDLAMLMARYQEGDFATASVLIDRMSPQLRRFFAVRFASRTDADDLLQETWLRIHKVRHTYRPGEQVTPWFYAIARHVRVDHYRRALRTSAREQTFDELSSVPAAVTAQVDPRPNLNALLAPLSESQREVIEMLKVDGMSLEEVARATSTTVGSVKQKVHRAYTKLRRAMSGAGRGRAETGGLS